MHRRAPVPSWCRLENTPRPLQGAVGDPCFFDASLTGGGNDGRSIHFNFRGARVLGELASVSRWSLPLTLLASNVAVAFVAVAFAAVTLVADALVAVAFVGTSGVAATGVAATGVAGGFARPRFVATGGSAAVTAAGFDLATLGLTASTAADWESVFEADLDATLEMTLEMALESTLETDSVFTLADFFAGRFVA